MSMNPFPTITKGNLLMKSESLSKIHGVNVFKQVFFCPYCTHIVNIGDRDSHFFVREAEGEVPKAGGGCVGAWLGENHLEVVAHKSVPNPDYEQLQSLSIQSEGDGGKKKPLKQAKKEDNKVGTEEGVEFKKKQMEEQKQEEQKKMKEMHVKAHLEEKDKVVTGNVGKAQQKGLMSGGGIKKSGTK